MVVATQTDAHETSLDHALSDFTDLAQNTPMAEDPAKNWQSLTPQQREDTQNSIINGYGPGNKYDHLKKEAPEGGMMFTPDFNDQDSIEKLKKEFDFEHYKDEKGWQYLIPRPKAPLVG